MEFIGGFLRTVRQHDSIIVEVGRLTKVVYFITLKSTSLASDIEMVFIRDMVRLHGVPKKTVSSKDAKFTYKFLKEKFTIMVTKLAFSTTYHQQIDGKTQRVKKIFDEMFSMCVIHHQQKWEEYLPLVEFTYNNGY